MAYLIELWLVLVKFGQNIYCGIVGAGKFAVSSHNSLRHAQFAVNVPRML